MGFGHAHINFGSFFPVLLGLLTLKHIESNCVLHRLTHIRHTLALGLTIVESNLDKLSSWNQGLIAHFLEKVHTNLKVMATCMVS